MLKIQPTVAFYAARTKYLCTRLWKQWRSDAVRFQEKCEEQQMQYEERPRKKIY